MLDSFARPGIIVARHSSSSREGTTLSTARDGLVEVLWFDNGEVEQVAAEALHEVVKAPGQRTTIGEDARDGVAELVRQPDDVVIVGKGEPPAELFEALRQATGRPPAEEGDDPEPDLPYRLEYLEDVQPGAVLLIPVECRNMRCRLAHHERECQVLDVRERGDVYSVKAADPDGKQVPLRGDAITLVKVRL